MRLTEAQQLINGTRSGHSLFVRVPELSSNSLIALLVIFTPSLYYLFVRVLPEHLIPMLTLP